MDEIFIVTREGVYRHEILGIFDKRYEAELKADEISQAESDDYHEIVVSAGPLRLIIEDTEPVSRFRKGVKPKMLRKQKERIKP